MWLICNPKLEVVRKMPIRPELEETANIQRENAELELEIARIKKQLQENYNFDLNPCLEEYEVANFIIPKQSYTDDIKDHFGLQFWS